MKNQFLHTLKHTFKNRRTVFRITLFVTLLSVVYSFVTKRPYESEISFMPNGTGSGNEAFSLGNLSEFVGLGSSNLSGEFGIPVNLYPKIITSVSFKQSLIDAELQVDGIDSILTYKEYFTSIYEPPLSYKIRKYTLGLPGVIINAIRSPKPEEIIIETNNEDQVIKLSTEDWSLINRLSGQIKVTESTSGLIVLSVSMPEAGLAGQMADAIFTSLQTVLKDYRLASKKKHLIYLKDLYAEKQRLFYDKQKELAKLKDSNVSLATQASRSSIDRLESEYSIAFKLYEQASIELQKVESEISELEPIISLIEKPVIPFKPSGFERKIIIAFGFILGVLISLAVVLLKPLYQEFIVELKE